MALTQQKPLALPSVSKVEATCACVCMGHGEAAGDVHVTVMGPRNISLAQSFGPFVLGTWTISIGGMDLRSV